MEEVIHGPTYLMPRNFFENAVPFKLSEEALRTKLRDFGIIEELERRDLWLGDATTSGRRGFSFQDFVEFYSRIPPRQIIRERKQLRGKGPKLRRSALQIKQALAAHRWAASLGADIFTPFDYKEHVIILRSLKDGYEEVVAPGAVIEEDVLTHLANVAERLEEVAKIVSVRGNQSKRQETLFIRTWEVFARSKCTAPLDEIGRRFSEIIFGVPIKQEAFVRARKRLAARKRGAGSGPK